MKVYVGCDHRGFGLKQELLPWLGQQGYEVSDCGNSVYDQDDDYPDFSLAVADAVAKAPGSRGIVICGSGVGVVIAANKVAGIRAANGVLAEEVRSGRQDDDMNVLALSADYTSLERARELISVFLKTEFVPLERFVRRLKKIAAREIRV